MPPYPASMGSGVWLSDSDPSYLPARAVLPPGLRNFSLVRGKKTANMKQWDNASACRTEGLLCVMNNENLGPEELLEKVRTAFQSSFDIDPKTITIDTVPSDIPAWDSMGHVTLATSLEKTFSLSFDVDDLMAMENVREICRVVQSKLTQVPSA